MRQELTATQTDVEEAMIELRDQKMAHLISLGGWLRGLEISASTVMAEFSPARAKVLSPPDFLNYCNEGAKNLAARTESGTAFHEDPSGSRGDPEPVDDKSERPDRS